MNGSADVAHNECKGALSGKTGHKEHPWGPAALWHSCIKKFPLYGKRKNALMQTRDHRTKKGTTTRATCLETCWDSTSLLAHLALMVVLFVPSSWLCVMIIWHQLAWALSVIAREKKSDSFWLGEEHWECISKSGHLMLLLIVKFWPSLWISH